MFLYLFGLFGLSRAVGKAGREKKESRMKLTGRQQAFLRAFLDVSREAHDALHYTTVAERLGVGRITAYDMLRLLEEKGLVTSEYVMPTSGPGRSTILFRPTEQAEAWIRQLAGKGWEQEEWEPVKARIVRALQAGPRQGYDPLLEEIVGRLPERNNPLIYAAEMVTAVILSLHQVREAAPSGKLWERLRDLGLPEEAGLNALAGLAVGLSLVEHANRRLTMRLLAATRQYQDSLASLGAEGRRLLSEFTAEVMRLVEA
jgi:DNA-binding PadR family transcriptional regulator